MKGKESPSDKAEGDNWAKSKNPTGLSPTHNSQSPTNLNHVL